MWQMRLANYPDGYQPRKGNRESQHLALSVWPGQARKVPRLNTKECLTAGRPGDEGSQAPVEKTKQTGTVV